jgi:ADP-ribose pyrophosphatase YjhB (NUDIX family)
MRFCSECGAPVRLRVPEGDDRERHVCEACGAVHYRNPRVVTGCLATHEGRILLCRRAIAPREGYWTLPAGFLENGETAPEGALRETWEEARASVELDGLYALFNLPHIDQLYLFFRGRLVEPACAPGPESLEVALVEPGAIPWDELAFPVIRDALRWWCTDREAGHFPVRSGDVLFSRGLGR